ncbi:MAG: CPBP family intramembrane metalloprotease [Tissierellia bacterium]|nr:CPBP family intramembrane metalloprotease [Tissierellia bacterium]
MDQKNNYFAVIFPCLFAIALVLISQSIAPLGIHKIYYSNTKITDPNFIDRFYWEIYIFSCLFQMIIISIVLYHNKKDVKPRSIPITKRIAFSSIILIFFFSALSVLYLILFEKLSDIFPNIAEKLTLYEELMDFGEEMTTSQLLFISAILAPIVEELVFRRYLYCRCCYYLSPNYAIILSAFVFALIHFNFVQSGYAFFGGLVLTYIYRKTGSLLLCIGLHMMNNFLGFMPINAPILLVFLFSILASPWAIMNLQKIQAKDQ